MKYDFYICIIIQITLNIMTKQRLYTVEWLDDYNETYETIKDLTYKQMVHYRQEAKYMHLDIRVTKQNS